MAEIKNGKITFTEEEQLLVDEIIKERVSREAKKAEALKTQIENLTADKTSANDELSKALKDTEALKNQLKTSGIEVDNLKIFTKQYKEQTEKLKTYQEAELLSTRKQAFVKAGGDALKFEKAIKLVDFPEKSEAEEVFKELLKDDSWAILRAENSSDPNTGEKSGEKGMKENVFTSQMNSLIFPKKDK